MKIKIYQFAYLVVLFFLGSCSKPNDYTTDENAEVDKQWNLRLLAASENHPTPGKADSARLQFVVMNNNSIRYDVFIDSLNAAGDRITKVQLQLGDPLTEGPVLLDLNPRLSGWYASGVINGVRQSLIDTIKNETIAKYVNVYTANAPTGLVRGQLGSQIVYAKNVELTGANVTPAVTTTTTGTAYIRIAEDRTLYSKIVINNPDAANAETAAGIYQGAPGATGALILNLATAATDFNVTKKIPLTETQYTQLLNNRSYVLVRSALNTSGKLRGQLR